ncbi:GTPase HflX [Babesia caballi]|uniref:GTPase HflX n=1 Tax=Babesia caballi TaxID=5871 RepID=A0AAV4LMT0_BABCB|nr:GTPase HflX [Babesia caballi]
MRLLVQRVDDRGHVPNGTLHVLVQRLGLLLLVNDDARAALVNGAAQLPVENHLGQLLLNLALRKGKLARDEGDLDDAVGLQKPRDVALKQRLVEASDLLLQHGVHENDLAVLAEERLEVDQRAVLVAGADAAHHANLDVVHEALTVLGAEEGDHLVVAPRDDDGQEEVLERLNELALVSAGEHGDVHRLGGGLKREGLGGVESGDAQVEVEKGIVGQVVAPAGVHRGRGAGRGGAAAVLAEVVEGEKHGRDVGYGGVAAVDLALLDHEGHRGVGDESGGGSLGGELGEDLVLALLARQVGEEHAVRAADGHVEALVGLEEVRVGRAVVLLRQVEQPAEEVDLGRDVGGGVDVGRDVLGAAERDLHAHEVAHEQVGLGLHEVDVQQQRLVLQRLDLGLQALQQGDGGGVVASEQQQHGDLQVEPEPEEGALLGLAPAAVDGEDLVEHLQVLHLLGEALEDAPHELRRLRLRQHGEEGLVADERAEHGVGLAGLNQVVHDDVERVLADVHDSLVGEDVKGAAGGVGGRRRPGGLRALSCAEYGLVEGDIAGD